MTMKPTLLASILLSWTAPLNSRTIDACSLLQQSEAEAAIGTKVLPPAKDAGKLGEIPFSHCTFHKSENLIGVLLTVYTYKSAAEVKTFFESSMKQAGDTEAVSGLGDAAFWWKSKGTMFVIKGSNMASIFIGTGVAGQKKAGQEIASKVASRMP
jgi:hypothetical protein